MALGMLALLLLAIPMSFGIPSSVGIVGGLRILEGDVPYRDFWTMYAPGHFYLLALLFLIFGKELIVASVAAVVIVACSAAVFFLIARQMGITRLIAWTVALLFVLMFWGPAPAVTTYQPALLFILISWLRWLRRGDSSGTRAALAAGGCVGLAAWFKHDVAAYAAIAIVVSDIVVHFARDRQGAWFEATRSALLIGAGAAAIVLPAVVWCWLVAGADAWQDMIRFPATEFGPSRPESYPGIMPAVGGIATMLGVVWTTAGWFRFNVPLLLWLAWLPTLARRGLRTTLVACPGVALLITSFPFFWLAAHVQINTHIWTMSAMALLLAGVSWDAAKSQAWTLRISGAAFAAVYAASLLLSPTVAAARIARDWPGSRLSPVPSLWGLTVPAPALAYYEPLAEFVRQSVPIHERIYVGLLRHDVIIGSNPMVYAVVGRLGCSRYDELHPAVADRSGAQRAIRSAIDQYHVRLAILWQFGYSKRRMDAIKAQRQVNLPGTGAELLDRFLAQEFRPVIQYGEYQIRWRDSTR
jgi:hypothetical protein